VRTGRRRRVKELVGRLRERRDVEELVERVRARRRAGRARREVRRHQPRSPAARRMRRRKAALALSVGAIGLNAAAMDFTPAPVVAPYSDRDPGVRRPALRLHVSEEMKEALIEEEDARYTVYRDPVGLPTVGVGHLVTPADGLAVGDRIDEDRVLDLFAGDLRKAEAIVVRLLGATPVNQHEFDALVDLAYNVGEGTLSAEESPRLNAAIAARDYQAIAAELDYRYAHGERLEGLALRSERRSNIFLDARYDNPRAVGATAAS
jgi:GH24 family phage-related lysozyme (muramidase)